MSDTQRRLTADEESELAALNAAVDAAIAARRDWLDRKMHETSRLQVGDDIYDIESGVKVGVVSELYRFWSDRDEGVRDKHAHCDYQYKTSHNGYDNTSRQYRRFGTREDAIRHAELHAARLRAAVAE